MARDHTCLILCQADRAGTDTQHWALMMICPSCLVCQPGCTLGYLGSWSPEDLDKQVPLNRLSEPNEPGLHSFSCTCSLGPCWHQVCQRSGSLLEDKVGPRKSRPTPKLEGGHLTHIFNPLLPDSLGKGGSGLELGWGGCIKGYFDILSGKGVRKEGGWVFLDVA